MDYPSILGPLANFAAVRAAVYSLLNRWIALIPAMVAAASVAAGSKQNSNDSNFYQQIVEANELLSNDDQNVLSDFRGGVYVSPARLQEAFDHFRPLMDLAQRANSLPRQHIGWDEGFGVLLPHLGILRTTARAFSAQTELALRRGDAKAAVAASRSNIELAKYVREDGFIISSLVGQAICSLADSDVGAILESGQMSPEIARDCMDLFQDFSGHDPFNYAQRLRDEGAGISSWIEKQLETDAGDELLEAITEIDGGSVGKLSEEDVIQDLPLYEEAMNRAADVLDIADPDTAQTALKNLEDDLEAGKYGKLAGLILPSAGHLLKRRLLAEQQIANRLELLQGIIDGRVGPGTFVNAARLYLRVYEAIESLDDDRREAVLALGRGTDEGDVDLAAATLVASYDSILEPLGRAARIEKCVFPESSTAINLPQPAGFLEAGRFLFADARLAVRNGDLDIASHRLGTLYRMIRHASDDDSLFTSLVASQLCREARTVIAPLIAADALNDSQRDEIVFGIARIHRSDPFGFIHAGKLARLQADQWVESLPDSLVRDTLARRLEPAGPSAALDLTAVRDAQFLLTYYPSAIADVGRLAERLDGVINVENLLALAGRDAEYPKSLHDWMLDRTKPVLPVPAGGIADVNHQEEEAPRVLLEAERGFEKRLESILVGIAPSEPPLTDEPDAAEVGDERSP